MNHPVIFLKNDKKQFEAKICAIPDWDGFDKLIKYITEEYHAVVLEEYDGPDARRWILESNGCQFELLHDDMFGNYVLAPTVESEEIVRKIGEDLERKLTNIENE